MNNTAKLVKLGNIAEVTQGQSPNSKYYSEESGTPFLQGNRTFGHLYPKFDTYTTRVTKIAKQGDVLMSVRAPVGDLNIAPSDLCIGRGLASLNSKVGSNYFIYYSLKYSVSNLQRQGAATTYSSVNKDLINDFDVIVPYNDNTWDSIAKVLFNIDRKIEVNNNLNQQLDELAKFIYDYWFVQFDFPDKNGKPYKSSGGKMVWNERLNRDIPEGWVVTSLGKVADITAGGDKPNIFSDKKSENCQVPIYSNGIENDGLYGFTDKSTVTEQSITISARGTIGYSLLRNHPFVPIIRLIVITPNSKGSAKYFHEYIKYIDFSKSGSVQQQLTVPQVSQVVTLVPPENILKRFDDVTSPSIKQIDILKEQNRHLATLRDWLLPLLMNGQVTVVSNQDVHVTLGNGLDTAQIAEGVDSLV